MKKFVPMINCGYCSGNTPMAWDNNPQLFDTEEECDAWIAFNEDNFTPNESEGGIYPYELDELGIKFYKDNYNIA